MAKLAAAKPATAAPAAKAAAPSVAKPAAPACTGKKCPTEAEIRARAEAIFKERQKSGAKGDSMSDWLQAERELKK